MPFGRIREQFDTLRVRLSVWNTAAMLSLMVITLWGLREALSIALLQEIDRQLMEDAREVQLTIRQLYPSRDLIFAEINRKAETHQYRGFYVRIFNDQREVVWNSINSPTQPHFIDPSVPEFVPLSIGEHRRLHFVLQEPEFPHWSVRVGTSFEPLRENISQITRLMMLVGLAVVIVSPLGGYWLAGRATRPLALIIATTDRLQPTSLDQRLPVRGTGDELDRLSITINGFLDRIARYVAQNREFTANAAHELRSPLAAMQSSLEVALNADRSIPEYKELLADVLDECQNLRVLVNQLLLLAESDAGRMSLGEKPVLLDRIVEQAVEMFEAVAESAGIKLQISQGPQVWVKGDAGRLRQVVNNLLDNAIKYTPPGGNVTLELRQDPHKRLAVLCVRDTGTGIQPQDIPRIFERFYRSDKARERDRGSRGLGLGLAICQSIVHAHHGQIAVTSIPDQGSTFTVQLPAA